MDTINELAELAFASRLKRLSEYLMKDISRLYHKLNINFEARWFTVLYVLNSKSPMTVTSLGRTLHISHTAVNQLVTEMARKGLVRTYKDKRDERQRLLSISTKGKEVVGSLIPIWGIIREATQELIDSTGCDLLTAIGKIEKQLDEKSIYERVWIELKDRLPAEIQILEYRPAYKKYFNCLNREWLEEYFSVEKEDEKVISNPNGKIIKKGGTIFFARLDKKIVGTAALICHRKGIFELAKMAVTKNAQGIGIGKKLTRRVIEHAKSLGASEVYLQTSPKLETANHLYRRFGFRKIQESPFNDNMFNRLTFTMKLIV